MKFSADYVRIVLNENFEDAKAQFVAPLLAIHYAHLVMLADRRIVTPGDAHAIREALDAIDVDRVRKQLREDAALTDAPRDQLRVLAAEVEDENFVVRRRTCSRFVSRSLWHGAITRRDHGFGDRFRNRRTARLSRGGAMRRHRLHL